MSMTDRATDEISREQKKFSLPETTLIVKSNLIKQLSKEKMYIPVWAGKPGIGKTTYAYKIADELNLNLYYVSMAKSLEFFMGLPITNKLTFDSIEDAHNNYVVWSEPEMIHVANMLAADKNRRGCLIFMDDCHIMDRSVQTCFFELVLERKLSNYKLADNVCMLAAMNDSSTSGFDGYLAAINNRLQTINVMMPFEDWYENCGADLNPLIASYCKFDAGNLEEEESTNEPFSTYRSWTTLSKLLDEPYKIYCKNGDKVWFMHQVKMIGAGFMSWKKLSSSFLSQIDTQLKYNFEQMVANNAYKVDRKEPIEQFCFGNIIRYLRNAKDVDNLVEYLKHEVTQNSVDEYKNVILNILYEALSYRKMLEKKDDDKSREKLNIIRQLQDKLWATKELNANRYVRDLFSKPAREIFAEIKR